MTLDPVFPWFGGKRRAAGLIWSALGDPESVIVPFAGALGDLLGRPTPPRREVINDLDAFVANFWRATKLDAESVWYWADDLVSEIDVRSKHQWLVDQREELRKKLEASPEWYDAKVAGWWVWGLCTWIGAGWCDPARVHHRPIPRARPGGIHRLAVSDLKAIATRLRHTIVTCGDWSRVLTPAYRQSTSRGVTGIILDPPYSEGDDDLYAHHDKTVSGRVRAWAIEHGDEPGTRIVLCGYEGEHKLPRSWRCVAWKATGGYGNVRKHGKNENGRRERLWLSPHCL